MRKILVVWYLILTIQAHKSDVVCSDSVCSFVVVASFTLTNRKEKLFLLGWNLCPLSTFLWFQEQLFVLCPCTSTSVIFNYQYWLWEYVGKKLRRDVLVLETRPFHSSNTRVVISLLYLRNALISCALFLQYKEQF